MNVLQQINGTVFAALDKQAISEDALYRKNTLCVITEVDGVPVAYNALTCEMAELTPVEAEMLHSDTVAVSAEAQALIEKWYLVPVDHDDIQLYEEVLSFVKLFQKQKRLSRYTILTTMDCNARCFYCYELGRQRNPMSLETAEKVADFIQKTCANEPIRLAWFGGEPLYNLSAIDCITSRLSAAGVPFRSSMISNGYLFDDAVVEKAVSAWKLYKVQITLDGTADVYDKVKAYIYKEEKRPFAVVTDNIERLLKKGVAVAVRMNLGEHNKADLYALVDYLAERYKAYRNFFVYAQMLFETEKDFPESRLSLAKDLLDLEAYCEQRGLAVYRKVPEALLTNKCMADAHNAVTVTPAGKLGKCEHFSESELIGDLCAGITDTKTVESFCERANSKELCAGCSAYSVCIRLKKCPEIALSACNAANRLVEETRLRRNVEHTYRTLKEKKKAE